MYVLICWWSPKKRTLNENQKLFPIKSEIYLMLSIVLCNSTDPLSYYSTPPKYDVMWLPDLMVWTKEMLNKMEINKEEERGEKIRHEIK